MTTAVDSNVLIALWNEDDRLNALARTALDAALERGNLVIAAPVFAELLDLGQPVRRAAGRAFQQYAARRKKQLDSGPRRILADFVIGAHAMQNGFRLLTLDDRLYRAAFPQLLVRAI
jgi:predicted nucleic acid-binding protein